MNLQTKLSVAALSTVATLTAATAVVPEAKAATIVEYQFGTFTSPTTAPTTVAPGMSASNFVRGSGLTLAPGLFVNGNPPPSYITNGWDGEQGDFLGFTITPGANVASFSLDKFQFDAGRNSNGPATVRLRSSLDGFSSVIKYLDGINYTLHHH